MDNIKKLDAGASIEDIVRKINEIIDRVNRIRQDTYITQPPSAYDLHAISRRLKK